MNQNLNQLYAPIRIVDVIKKGFLKYRGLKLVPSDSSKTSRNNLIDNDLNIVKSMQTFGYVRIDAINNKIRGKRNNVIFIILDVRNIYSDSSHHIRKLLETIHNEPLIKEGKLDELIIIAPDEFFKKNIIEEINKYHLKNPKNEDKNGSMAFYNAYPYHIFIFIIPEHISVSSHKILSKDEILKKSPYLIKQHLKTIFINDPPIVWANGKEGQIVEIIKDSADIGKIVEYKRIIPKTSWI